MLVLKNCYSLPNPSSFVREPISWDETQNFLQSLETMVGPQQKDPYMTMNWYRTDRTEGNNHVIPKYTVSDVKNAVVRTKEIAELAKTYFKFLGESSDISPERREQQLYSLRQALNRYADRVIQAQKSHWYSPIARFFGHHAKSPQCIEEAKTVCSESMKKIPEQKIIHEQKKKEALERWEILAQESKLMRDDLVRACKQTDLGKTPQEAIEFCSRGKKKIEDFKAYFQKRVKELGLLILEEKNATFAKLIQTFLTHFSSLEGMYRSIQEYYEPEIKKCEKGIAEIRDQSSGQLDHPLAIVRNQISTLIQQFQRETSGCGFDAWSFPAYIQLRRLDENFGKKFEIEKMDQLIQGY